MKFDKLFEQFLEEAKNMSDEEKSDQGEKVKEILMKLKENLPEGMIKASYENPYSLTHTLKFEYKNGAFSVPLIASVILQKDKPVVSVGIQGKEKDVYKFFPQEASKKIYNIKGLDSIQTKFNKVVEGFSEMLSFDSISEKITSSVNSLKKILDEVYGSIVNGLKDAPSDNDDKDDEKVEEQYNEDRNLSGVMSKISNGETLTDEETKTLSVAIDAAKKEEYDDENARKLDDEILDRIMSKVSKGENLTSKQIKFLTVALNVAKK